MDNNVATIAWAMVRINKSDAKEYKILAECYDAQTNRVNWRLSSNLTGVTVENGKYMFNTKMGCVYICQKDAEDVTKLIEDTLKNLEESFEVDVVPALAWIAVKCTAK